MHLGLERERGRGRERATASAIARHHQLLIVARSEAGTECKGLCVFTSTLRVESHISTLLREADLPPATQSELRCSRVGPVRRPARALGRATVVRCVASGALGASIGPKGHEIPRLQSYAHRAVGAAVHRPAAFEDPPIVQPPSFFFLPMAGRAGTTNADRKILPRPEEIYMSLNPISAEEPATPSDDAGSAKMKIYFPPNSCADCTDCTAHKDGGQRRIFISASK